MNIIVKLWKIDFYYELTQLTKYFNKWSVKSLLAFTIKKKIRCFYCFDLYGVFVTGKSFLQISNENTMKKLLKKRERSNEKSLMLPIKII